MLLRRITTHVRKQEWTAIDIVFLPWRPVSALEVSITLIEIDEEAELESTARLPGEADS